MLFFFCKILSEDCAFFIWKFKKPALQPGCKTTHICCTYSSLFKHMFYTFCMHKHHTRVSYTFKKVSLERFLHFEEEHVTGRFIVRVLEAVKVCWLLFRQKGHIRCQLFCHILHIYILCDFY